MTSYSEFSHACCTLELRAGRGRGSGVQSTNCTYVHMYMYCTGRTVAADQRRRAAVHTHHRSLINTHRGSKLWRDLANQTRPGGNLHIVPVRHQVRLLSRQSVIQLAVVYSTDQAAHKAEEKHMTTVHS